MDHAQHIIQGVAVHRQAGMAAFGNQADQIGQGSTDFDGDDVPPEVLIPSSLYYQADAEKDLALVPK